MSITVEFTFHPRPPYDFALTASAARFYCPFGPPRPDGVWARPIRIDGRPALLELRGGGTSDRPVVRARIVGPVSDGERARAHAARIVGGGIDLPSFYRAAERDPALAETTTRLRGLGVFQLDSLWEALAITLIEQQIALRQAQIAERWLIATYGDPVAIDGATGRAFPTPERIAALTVDDLRPLKITFIRMARLIELARQIADGRLDLEALRDQPLDEAYARIRQIAGVGHWTAAWAFIRARGDFLALGRADVALRAAVNHYVHGQRGRIAPAALDAYFEPLGDWAGLAQFYILMRWALERYG
ncbi:MAG: DNA-3-methyladenine glycosylase family protein [Candidatus Flexifilum sp.]